LNHTNTKGLNDLSVDELVVILSHPAQEHVARVMICTGLDEDEAVSIIMGDNAIQAIGRSQGYRNKSNPIDGPSTGDNKTLVVIPNSVDVDLNNVTPNVVRGSSLKDGGKPYLSVNSSLLRKFHFKDIILDIFPVSDECGAIVSAIDSLGNSEQNVIPIDRIAEETGISPKTVSKRAKELGYECKRLVIDGKRQQYLMAA
jgi:hypothetical protein